MICENRLRRDLPARAVAVTAGKKHRYPSLAALVLLVGAAACEQPLAPEIGKEAPVPLMNASAAGEIIIDDFDTGGGIFGGSWWGYTQQNSVSGAIGGSREHGWYNYGRMRVDVTAGTLEWGLSVTTSPHFGVSYGSAIGTKVSGVGSNPNSGPQLNLNLTTQDEFVVDVVKVTASHVDLVVKSGNGETFKYILNLTAPGEVRVPLHKFKSEWTGQVLSAAKAADIDGIHLFGFGHGSTTGGTKFGRISIVPGVVDADGDGFYDDADNCPAVANADQADLDSDGTGDSCDGDIDGDGVANGDDAYPTDASESADSDGDGTGDNADAFPHDPTETTDSDGDNVGDNGDVFPNDPSEWADSDADGTGDNADAYDNSNTGAALVVDTCNTGVANWEVGNGMWANDVIAAAKASAANHGAFVKAMTKIADGWKKAGLITGRQQGAILSCV